MRGPNGRLHDYIAKVAHEGEQDCALFQANCHLALTGYDPAAEWRGKYATYRQGLRLMREAGYKNPKDFVRAIADRVQPQDVQTGDMCFIGNAGAVFIGTKVFALGQGRKGLTVTELSHDAEIYRIRSRCQQ